jgi:uncharacterized protein YyaL (SSP411 family)
MHAPKSWTAWSGQSRAKLPWRGVVDWPGTWRLIAAWVVIWAVASPPAFSRDEKPARKSSSSRSNRLARETSPYLLAHAQNPVDWFPWGPEALEKARREDKPIFLSIGYSSCHWCHVMEEKVFSNPEIAEYMNRHFVCIKVDREERPDLDDIYMAALQAYYRRIGSPQAGGWPLSLFLTPDARPLGGGTYIPPKSEEDGRTGFPDLMRNLVAAWTNPESRKTLNDNATVLVEDLKLSQRTPPVLARPELNQELAGQAWKALQGSFDPEHGGFGFSPRAPQRPKFPVPPKLAFLEQLCRGSTQDQSEAAARMLDLTLARMAAGGIHDHVGGGFHRYSTDRAWRIPHFEKMLYDNAQLASVYTAAYARTRQRSHRQVAEGILEFVLREMTDARGGFYAALDADANGVEGAYYAWSLDQLQEVLSAEELGVCQQVYGVSGTPNFEEGFVLLRSETLEESAGKLQVSVDALESSLAEIHRKLLRERVRRKPPARDDKILCGWNGLMIAALAEASVVFERPEYLRAAREAAEFVLQEMRQENGRFYRSYCRGEARHDAYLEDYAFLVRGLLALGAAARDDRWFTAARRLTDLQLQLFWDNARGGCFATSTEHETLLIRTKPLVDSVLPSGNSVTAINLLEIARLSGEPEYRRQAESLLREFAPYLADRPESMCNLATAVLLMQSEDAPAPAARPAVPIRLMSNGEPRAADPAPRRKPASKVTAEVLLSADPLPPGGTCRVLVLVEVAPGWHIHGNPAGDPEGDNATELSLDSELGLKLQNIEYPRPRLVEREDDLPPARYLEGKVAIRATLQIPKESAGMTEELPFELLYQACNDASCLRPQTLKLVVPVRVARRLSEARPAHEDKFQTPPAKPKTPPSKTRRG